MMGMWFGLEIDVVGLPPLGGGLKLLFSEILFSFHQFFLQFSYFKQGKVLKQTVKV